MTHGSSRLRHGREKPTRSRVSSKRKLCGETDHDGTQGNRYGGCGNGRWRNGSRGPRRVGQHRRTGHFQHGCIGASFADDPGTASTGRAASTVDPCTLPQAQRKGGWLCIDRGESEQEMRSQIAREKLANGTLGSRKGFAVAGDGVSGKCLITGCWYIQTGYASASFSGKGYYGVNSTQLGSITLTRKTT
jgi:hypothetical protein